MKTSPPPLGEVRQGQVLGTYGPGAMVDLPHTSILIGGLDHWRGVGREIHEPRLRQRLSELLERPDLRLKAPPVSQGERTPSVGIGVVDPFPRWFLAQDVDGRKQSVRGRRLVPAGSAQSSAHGWRYTDDETKKKARLVPVRFIRACPHGHLGDIDWYAFIHRGRSDCWSQRLPLWIEERSTTGDLAALIARCTCGKGRTLADAKAPGALGHCDGARPWLGLHDREACSQPNRLLVRTASNGYFAQTYSAISLPEPDDPVAKAVAGAWNDVAKVENAAELGMLLKLLPKLGHLGEFDAEAVLRAIEAQRRGPTEPSSTRIRQPEIAALLASPESLNDAAPPRDFLARTLPRNAWWLPNDPVLEGVDRVVLVHRLREVVAQVGFTRLEAPTRDVDGELDLQLERAPLAYELNWLTTIENRGEGIFVSLSGAAVAAWRQRPAVMRRELVLRSGFDAWLAEHPNSARVFPGAPYVLLHSLAHLLITTIALECGYAASAVKERIYVDANEGSYGLLLYTASPDAEGTLGGLVDTGRRIAQHLRAANDLGRLCSSDPVCAQHTPDDVHERRFLQGAACHGCLLIAETSCEQFNDFLDRALVVPTLDAPDAAFFRL